MDIDLLRERLSAIRMLMLDVDGVMTDGTILLGTNDEFKGFHSQDGTAVKYLMRSGVNVAIVTGRQSASVERRARELGIVDIAQKALRKWPAAEELIKQKGLRLEEVAFMGDDLVDLPVMIRVGLGIAVANATEDVKRYAHAVTECRGGEGAVREVAEAILKAQGKWEPLVESYLQREALPTSG